MQNNESPKIGRTGKTEADFIKAIKGSCGNISTIAEILQIEWATANTHITKKPTEAVKAAYQAEIEKILDETDNAEIAQMRMGKEWAIQSLRRRLYKFSIKDRGYIFPDENINDVIVIRKKPIEE